MQSAKAMGGVNAAGKKVPECLNSRWSNPLPGGASAIPLLSDLFHGPWRRCRSPGDLHVEAGMALEAVNLRLPMGHVAFGTVQRHEMGLVRISFGKLRGGCLLRQFFVAVMTAQAAVVLYRIFPGRQPFTVAS